VLDNLSTGDAGYLDLGNTHLEFVIGDIRRRSVVRQALQVRARHSATAAVDSCWTSGESGSAG
jgi:hypothetical protein